MKSRSQHVRRPGLAPVVCSLLGAWGCAVATDDDDAASDDTTSGDDDTAAGDDTGSDDDSALRIVEEGSAVLGGDAGDWTTWTGSETYGEWLGDVQTCDLDFSTAGVATGVCTYCEFTFDVVYTLVEDRSVDCPEPWLAPLDQEALTFGFFDYYGYGYLVYYATFEVGTTTYAGFYFFAQASYDAGVVDYRFDNGG